MNRNALIGPTVAGLALLFFAGSLLSGCISTRDTGSRQRVYGVEQDIQELNSRLQRLEQQTGKEPARGSNLAELSSRMEELRVQIGQLNGRLDEQEHRLDQIQSSPRASLAEERPEARISAGASASPTDEAKPAPNIEIPKSETPDRLAMAPPVSPPPPLAPPPAPEPPKGVPPIQPPPSQNPEKAAFDRAFDLFQKNQFASARQQFQGFLKQYPQSSMADTALYWVGECYFSEKQYPSSIETFQQVLNRYPNGSKAPNAMLKQAAAYQQVGDRTAARILYERLIEKHPRSPQAQIAKQKLKQMP
jgi:tol-pal system protein YbgF